ncbi:hypothetical protein F4811DRAFT_210825 [Daldinia bambusicola]|nr:hypothetical protein F4811DRAFT_210825 [Daldinia bambusicola]
MVYLDEDSEQECPICGCPFRMSGHYGWILETVPGPVPPEFRSEDGIDSLICNEMWLGDVTMLCDPDDEMGRLIPSFAYENIGKLLLHDYPSTLHLPQPLAKPSEISMYRGEHKGGPRFTISDIEDNYAKCIGKVNIDDTGFETFDKRAYIPIHSDCLRIAQRVISNSSNKYISSVRSLFLALRWRHAISLTFGAAPLAANYTLGPTTWYRPPGCFWEWNSLREDQNGEAQWPGPSRDAKFNLLYTFLSNPVDIENITEILLLNLEPVQTCALEDEYLSFQARLMALPEEIFQLILSHLRSLRDFPLKTNNVLPQHFWKNEFMLREKGLLPWLWDINSDMIDAKANEPCPGGQGFEWNWELLARKLSRGVDGGIRLDVPNDVQVFGFDYSWDGLDDQEGIWACTGYHDIMEHVPQGLHNRRRIWQLVEEMFVGDQLPITGENVRAWGFMPAAEKSVELPWTKGGNLRDSAIWLPTISLDCSFARRVGGEVYRISETYPFQYWQTEEYMSQNGKEWDSQEEPASVTEILEAIRKLGYHVR